MQVTLSQIPMREILHFLGWHGTPVEPPLMEQIRRIRGEALEQVKPRAVMRRFGCRWTGRMPRVWRVWR